jgi:adenosine deaminase
MTRTTASPLPPGVRFPERLPLGRPSPGGATRDPHELHDRLPETLRRLWALPKVELHLHLEGALRPETVCDLARRYAPRSPLCRPEWHRQYWTFGDLTGFATELRRVLDTCLRTQHDYYRAALECFEDLAAQQVVYAEVSFNPRTFGQPHFVSLEHTLAPVEQARSEIEARTPLRVGLILGLSRLHPLPYAGLPGPTEAATRLLREAIRARDEGAAIVGIDLHGNEQVAPDVTPFVPVFREAGEAGLGRRAHAGEGAGPAAVWATWQALGVQRLAHGVRAIEDPRLVRALAHTRTPLDLCPTSNVLTGVAPTFAAHPVRALHDAGLVLTISSDDPLAFGTSLSTELALLHHLHAFTFDDLAHLQIQAATVSFLSDARRSALAAAVRAAWASRGTS